MISFEKLSEMAILAFKNGLRLHFDSVILLNNNSYATATMISVLAMEEFGKYFSLSSYVFYTSVNESRDEKYENEFLNKLYIHPFKQSACFGRDGFEPSQVLIGKANDRYYENLKQRSLYVGYDREKGKILYNNEVNNPENINEGIASKQILFLNDMIIEMVNQHLSGIIEMDEEEVNELLNEGLLKKLKFVLKIKPSSVNIGGFQ